jgi:hypothetical protein
MNKENISDNVISSSTDKSTSSTSKYSHHHYVESSSSPLEDLKSLSLEEVKKRGSCKECKSLLNPPCKTTIQMDCIGQFKGIEKFPPGSQVVFRDMSALSHIFSTTMALRLNIFEVIQMYNSNSFMCLKEIRSLLKGTNMSERSLRDLMMVLVSQGLLEVSGEIGSEKFRNTELTNTAFLSSSPLNECKSYLSIEKFMNVFLDYTKSGYVHSNLLNHSDSTYLREEDAESDLDYYYKSSDMAFRALFENFDFSRFSKITDIRGGSGRISMEIKGRFPNSEVRSFDKPSLEKFALRNVESFSKPSNSNPLFTTLGTSTSTGSGCYSVPCTSTSTKSGSCSGQVSSTVTSSRPMSPDIKVLSGSLISDSLPESDCVLAPYIFMHYNSDNLRTVLRNVNSCLRPNGQLVIMERLLHGDRSDSTSYAMSFMMQILNCEGYTRTFEELRSSLIEAGFRNVERKEIAECICDMIVCTK